MKEQQKQCADAVRKLEGRCEEQRTACAEAEARWGREVKEQISRWREERREERLEERKERGGEVEELTQRLEQHVAEQHSAARELEERWGKAMKAQQVLLTVYSRSPLPLNSTSVELVVSRDAQSACLALNRRLGSLQLFAWCLVLTREYAAADSVCDVQY
eukprot:921573-Rhodomonas_salina.1